jgi:hypothetical protein
MKHADGPERLDEDLRRALDLPAEAAARVVRGALRPAPRPARPGAWRWLPLTAALVLSLAVALCWVRLAERPAPRRASITNVGDVVIVTTPGGEGRLLRSEGAEPAPSGITLIVHRGGNR